MCVCGCYFLAPVCLAPYAVDCGFDSSLLRLAVHSDTTSRSHWRNTATAVKMLTMATCRPAASGWYDVNMKSLSNPSEIVKLFNSD